MSAVTQLRRFQKEQKPLVNPYDQSDNMFCASCKGLLSQKECRKRIIMPDEMWNKMKKQIRFVCPSCSTREAREAEWKKRLEAKRKENGNGE